MNNKGQGLKTAAGVYYILGILAAIIIVFAGFAGAASGRYFEERVLALFLLLAAVCVFVFWVIKLVLEGLGDLIETNYEIMTILKNMQSNRTEGINYLDGTAAQNENTAALSADQAVDISTPAGQDELPEY